MEPIQTLKQLYAMYESQLAEGDITKDEFKEAEKELQAVARRLEATIY